MTLKQARKTRPNMTFRIAATAFVALAMVGSAQALPGLPALPTDAVGISNDTSISTPVGGISAGAGTSGAHACADVNTGAASAVTGLVPVPVPLPVSAPTSAAGACAGADLDDMQIDADYYADTGVHDPTGLLPGGIVPSHLSGSASADADDMEVGWDATTDSGPLQAAFDNISSAFGQAWSAFKGLLG